MLNMINPDFSVYSLLMHQARGNLAVNHTCTMAYMSHLIEQSAMTQPDDLVLYACFQTMSQFLPSIPSFMQLAERVRHIYIFGMMDTELPAIDNITYVPLHPSDKLAKEWFMVAYGRHYASALASEESQPLNGDLDPTFQGTWTFNHSVVKPLLDELAHIVGETNEAYDETLTQKQSLRNLHQALSQIQTAVHDGGLSQPLTNEINHVVTEYLQPEHAILRHG